MLVMTATAFAETTSEKLVEDNYALAGKVLSPKAITVDWATQKLVAVLETHKYGQAQVWNSIIRSSLFSIAIRVMQAQQATIRKLPILLP